MRSRGFPRPLLTPYQDVIARPWNLRADVSPGTLLRIESPGRDAEVRRLIMNRGYRAAFNEGRPAVSPADVARLVSVKGLIVDARQWYLGFCGVLRDIEAAVDRIEAVRFSSAPDDIRVLFDKSMCHSRLRQAGLPVPEGLGSPDCWDAMLSAMRSAHCSRVFAKLRHGSAASGVIALETSHGRVQAWTTVDMDSSNGSIRLFNSRRVRCNRNVREVAQLVNVLCQQGLHVERWVPKAGVAGHRFDLRVLVVAGKPAHTVARLAETPITNLHLGNQRATLESVRARIDDDNWNRLLLTCQRVGAVFHRSLHVAVDLAVSPCGRRHWILEVNAFGDLLRGSLHAGMNPYELQVATLFGQGAMAHDVQGCAV